MNLHDSALVTAVRHNPGTFTALVLCTTLVGCTLFPFKVASPTDPKVQVTREQLNAQIIEFNAKEKAAVDAFYAQAERADKELDRKETFATVGLKTLNDLAASSGLPIPAVLTGVMTLLTGGLALDNRRKDTKLLLANEEPPPKAVP